MENRGKLIDYLLHRMAEEERTAFAEHWFTDPEIRRELHDIEAELMDGYARGSVSGEERALIEQWLLNSAGQRQKLAFAEALAAACPKTPRRRISWMLVGAIAAALILAAALSILMVRNRRVAAELAAEQAGRSRPQVQASGSVFAVFLPADTLRSSTGNALHVPAGAGVIHLELGLESGDPEKFDAIEVSASGRTVWRQQPAIVEGPAAARRVSLWIPASLFTPGNYTVKLESGAGAIGFYSFTVLPGPPA